MAQLYTFKYEKSFLSLRAIPHAILDFIVKVSTHEQINAYIDILLRCTWYVCVKCTVYGSFCNIVFSVHVHLHVD